MRTFFIALGITGILIVTALLIAPSVIDWNAYRGALAQELSRTTGRAVSLDGPLEASFLPAPRILANNVRLSGAVPSARRTGEPEDVLRLRAVELQVGLLPLLTGRVVVERLTLVKPEFLIETDKDGTVRWVMDGAGGDLLPEVTLQRMAISDGTLVWRDRRSNTQTRVESIFLKLVAETLAGPANAQGTARVGDVPVKFTAAIGAFRETAPTPFNVSLEATSLKAKGDFVGQFAPDGRVSGRLKANGSDGRALLAAFGRDAATGVAPALLAHRFAVEAKVTADAEAVEASDVVLDLADQRATGTARARFADGKTPAVDVALRLPRLNLDSLATVPPIAAPARSAVLPGDVALALSLEADAVLAAGRAVQGFAVDAALDRGRLDLRRLEGQLPGAGTVKFNGVVVPAGASYRFDGTVETAAASLRDLLSWLDVDTRAVPGGRLGRATLKAKLSVGPQQAELKDVDLHVDSTRAHGTVRLDYRERPNVALDLTADRLDVDAYMSDGRSSEAPRALSDVAGEARLSIGQLIYGDVDMRDVDLTAALKDGAFTVSRFSGGPPDMQQLFARRPETPPLQPMIPTAAPPAASPPPAAHPAPVAAVQAPAVALDAGTIAVPAQPAPAEADPRPDPADATPSRDDFVRDLLKQISR